MAYELINGWSFSAGAQLGGNEAPGMWMTGSAMRLLERCRDGVLSTDLLACHRYANGLAAAAAVRCPTLAILAARDVMAPVRNAQALVAALSDVKQVTLARHRPQHDGRAARRRARRATPVPLKTVLCAT